MASANDNMRWERVPADGDLEGEYRMTRTPTTGREIKLICMSDDFEGARIHYNGRTVPCFGAGCQECARNISRRWRGWILAQVSGTTERVIFEFPALAGKRLDLFYKEFQTLRGLNLIFSRPSGKSNGKVHVQCSGKNQYAHTIPKVPPIREILARIWGLARTCDELHAGGMLHQEVSEAELHEDADAHIHPPIDRSLVTKPLFQPLPDGSTIKLSDMLDIVGKSAIANEVSIEKSNGGRHAKKGRRQA